jgi:UDP-N-acetylmuramoyl-L-alanyl-D-glutamate--2,6-diaminopimelate ligase
MEEYWQEKQRLFTEYHPRNAIVNLDNEFGIQLAEKYKEKNKKNANNLFTFSTEENEESASIRVKELSLDNHGIKAKIHSPWGTGDLNSPILGRFNLSNLLAAIAAVCIQGIPIQEVLKVCKDLQTVPGRMVRVGGKKAPLVVIDYAHTPDALSEVLQALKPHCRGKLWCVFGCGGDRDRGKRPKMAQFAEDFCDELVITQDNPRTEDPNQIIQEILKGLKNPKNAFIEGNRAKAIRYAIQSAMSNDVILVAGKGHETYQIIGEEKKPFSDKKEVELALERRADAF